MRLKPKERPNSAQPPPQLGSPGAQPVPSLNLPNRAMSVSVKPQSSSKEGSRYTSYSQQSQSLSKAYSNSGQRPPINPELHKLLQPDWPGDCKEDKGGRRGAGRVAGLSTPSQGRRVILLQFWTIAVGSPAKHSCVATFVSYNFSSAMVNFTGQTRLGGRG